MEHNNAKRDLNEFETFLQRESRSTIVCACVLIEEKVFIGSLMLIWQLVAVGFVSCLSRV